MVLADPRSAARTIEAVTPHRELSLRLGHPARNVGDPAALARVSRAQRQRREQRHAVGYWWRWLACGLGWGLFAGWAVLLVLFLVAAVGFRGR